MSYLETVKAKHNCSGCYKELRKGETRIKFMYATYCIYCRYKRIIEHQEDVRINLEEIKRKYRKHLILKKLENG